MPALLFMVVFMLAICSQHSMPARLLMFMLAVEVHACTDITGHAHACCLSTTLLPARLFMFMPGVEVHACIDVYGHAHAECFATILVAAQLFMPTPGVEVCGA